MFMFNNEKTNIRKNYLSKKKRVLYPYIPVKNIKKKEANNEEKEADGRIITNYEGLSTSGSRNYSNHLQQYSNISFEQLTRTVNNIMVDTGTTKPVTKKVKTNITVSKHPYNGKYDFKIEFLNVYGYTDHVDIVGFPTSNCQLSSLGLAKNILLVQDSDKEGLLNTIKANVLAQFIVDINTYYE